MNINIITPSIIVIIVMTIIIIVTVIFVTVINIVILYININIKHLSLSLSLYIYIYITNYKNINKKQYITINKLTNKRLNKTKKIKPLYFWSPALNSLSRPQPLTHTNPLEIIRPNLCSLTSIDVGPLLSKDYRAIEDWIDPIYLETVAPYKTGSTTLSHQPKETRLSPLACPTRN